MSETLATTEPAPKERNLGVLWVIVILSLLVGLAAAWYIIGALRERAVMERMNDYIKASFSMSSIEPLVCGNFQGARDSSESLGQNIKAEIKNAELDGDKAQVEVLFNVPDLDNFQLTTTFEMVRENGEWKVCDPKLASGLRRFLSDEYARETTPE